MLRCAECWLETSPISVMRWRLVPSASMGYAAQWNIGLIQSVLQMQRATRLLDGRSTADPQVQLS
jgi:hypothetical protein